MNLAGVNAGTGDVELTSSVDILSSNGAGNDIVASNATLVAGGRIGADPADTVGFNVPGTINLTFGIPPAFIDFSGNPTINSTGAFYIGGEVNANITTASSTQLKGIGYIDWSLFSEDLNLFGVVEPGLLLPPDQIEDQVSRQDELKLVPDASLLVSTLRGWEYLSGFRQVSWRQPAADPSPSRVF